jgi:hypothetical protein
MQLPGHPLQGPNLGRWLQNDAVSARKSTRDTRAIIGRKPLHSRSSIIWPVSGVFSPPISLSNMAEIATIIISLVSWGSRLALDLYKLGGAVSSATRDINRVAKTVTLLSLTLKQVGATIKEDDIVPSPEVCALL